MTRTLSSVQWKAGSRGRGDEEGHDALRDASQAAQAKIAAGHLKQRRDGAQQHAVELSQADRVWEDVESRAEYFRKAEADRHDRVEHRDFTDRPAEQRGKVGEVEEYSEKF